MWQKNMFIPLVGFSFVLIVFGQTNKIRPFLTKCYNTSAIPGITIAENRPPTNLNILLELIRRIEDSNTNLTPRDLSLAILQRFRQDGILYTGAANSDLLVKLPYGPYGNEAYKSTVILTKYIADTPSTLQYGDLQDKDLCALHYLMSSSIDSQVRGDESTTCIRSARYTSRRHRRNSDIDNVGSTKVPPTISGYSPKNDIEQVGEDNARSILTNKDASQCPIELGVVYTNYGTIKVGQVLSGIATGFNQENVQSSDNRYAATLAGDISEVALSQGTLTEPLIGVQGGWNSTINPKYYFIQKNSTLELTDADIRGSLDGLYMALKADSWKSSRDIKMSQILDMYYSPYQKGVFDAGFKACNRNILYSDLVTTETLTKEVLSFMTPLDDGSSFGFTAVGAYPGLTEAAVNAFNKYLPKMITNDVSCTPLETIERVATDLLIFLDSSWNYNTLQPVLSYILDNIDVNRFGTRYTIFSGNNAVNITNSTRQLLNFHNTYNLSIHQSLSSGFDYQNVYETVERIVKSKLDNNTYTGGESTVVLIVPKTIPNDGQKSFLESKKEQYRDILPDLNIVILGTGSQADYTSITTTPAKDFISLQDTTNENDIKRMGQAVVDRIKSAPRAVVNPACTSSFSGSSSSFSLTQYVEKRGVNYYRIAPNYFHSGSGSKTLKVTENSYGTIEVCTSRDESRPGNTRNSDCEILRARVKEININGHCGGSLRDCLPIYVAVTGVSTDTRCTDMMCRFPDDVKYTISMENVGCYSSSVRDLASLLLIGILCLLLRI